MLELKMSDLFIWDSVMTVVRASVPLMILDDVFEQKNEIANSVKEELEKVQGLRPNLLKVHKAIITCFCLFILFILQYYILSATNTVIKANGGRRQ